LPELAGLRRSNENIVVSPTGTHRLSLVGGHQLSSRRSEPAASSSREYAAAGAEAGGVRIALGLMKSAHHHDCPAEHLCFRLTPCCRAGDIVVRRIGSYKRAKRKPPATLFARTPASGVSTG
jgi:hypothetical protein